MPHLIAPRFIGPTQGQGSELFPTGVVVGYEGSVASIPTGWLLCDGSSGTPDLRDRFVIGANDVYIGGTTGGPGTPSISSLTSTDGLHTGPGSSQIIWLGEPNGFSAAQAASGAHAHDISGDLTYEPPCKTLIYIMATTELLIPASAIMHRFDDTVPTGFSECDSLHGRFVKGVGDDTRELQGSDEANIDLEFASAGDHQHATPNPNGDLGGGPPYGQAITAGAHTHPAFNLTPELEKPNWFALLPITANSATGAVSSLIVGYAGDMGDLPSSWAICDGENGTPDLGGRLIIGADELFEFGTIGGTNDDQIMGDTLPTYSPSHSHDNPVKPSSADQPTGGFHTTYTWSHSHSFSLSISSLPSWAALKFIMFVGDS